MRRDRRGRARPPPRRGRRDRPRRRCRCVRRRAGRGGPRTHRDRPRRRRRCRAWRPARPRTGRRRPDRSTTRRTPARRPVPRRRPMTGRRDDRPDATGSRPGEPDLDLTGLAETFGLACLRGVASRSSDRRPQEIDPCDASIRMTRGLGVAAVSMFMVAGVAFAADGLAGPRATSAPAVVSATDDPTIAPSRRPRSPPRRLKPPRPPSRPDARSGRNRRTDRDADATDDHGSGGHGADDATETAGRDRRRRRRRCDRGRRGYRRQRTRRRRRRQRQRRAAMAATTAAPMTMVVTAATTDPGVVRVAVAHDGREPNRSSRANPVRTHPVGRPRSSPPNQPTRSTIDAMTARSSTPCSPATETRIASWSNARGPPSSGPAIGSSAISTRLKMRPRRRS